MKEKFKNQYNNLIREKERVLDMMNNIEIVNGFNETGIDAYQESLI
ncbi:MAG: hypothetical protein PHT79_02030 [Syntrophomonadaceae bacterium]|nr:hypothetical protein [Syntrophomonadaceae bacterium]